MDDLGLSSVAVAALFLCTYISGVSFSSVCW
jgi:hypothetical protein